MSPEYQPEYYELDEPIRAFTTKRLIGIERGKTVQEAAEKMVEFQISSLVVTEDSDIVGLLTDGDFKKKVVAKGFGPDTLVDDAMTTDLITTEIDTSVKEVLRVMSDKEVKRVLVEEDGEIVGMLTFADLIGVERQRLETYISRE